MNWSMEVAPTVAWLSAAFCSKCEYEHATVKPCRWDHQTKISLLWVKMHLLYILGCGRLSAHLVILNDASRTSCTLLFPHHPPWWLLCPILRPLITHQTILLSWCRLSPLVSGSFVSLAPPEGIVSISDQRTSTLYSWSIRTACSLWRWRCLVPWCFLCTVMVVLLVSSQIEEKAK